VLFLSFVAVEADDVGAADPPPDPDAFIFSLLEKYISSGCKGECPDSVLIKALDFTL